MNKRFEFIEIINTEEGKFALLFDTETQTTMMSPIQGQATPQVVTTPASTTKATSIVPKAFRVDPVVVPIVAEGEGGTSVAEVPVIKKKNPHAVAHPHFAWQDPDWESPEERRTRQEPPPPIFGKQITKIFKDPGKFGEEATFHV